MMNPFNHAVGAVSLRIWVVMFDDIPRPDSFDLPVASEQLPTETLSFDAFDDLDANSDYFEQFVAQNVTEAATECDRLGGAAVLRETLRAIQQFGVIAGVRVTPTPMPDDSAFVKESVLAEIRELGGHTRAITLDERSGEVPQTNPPELIHRASFLWFSVASCKAENAAVSRESVLRHILSWQQSLGDNDRPMLLVTGLRGEPKPLESPLESGLDENLIHLPLWFDQGLQHPRRIQSLVGSFDLLPTIADAFGCELPSNGENTSAAGSPNSILPLCIRRFDRRVESDDPKAQPEQKHEDRILTILGDGWTALRAQQYLLVRKMTEIDHEGIRQSEAIRQMFLKPDDAWNANDMIVPFEAIADEMEARVLTRTH